MPRSFSSRRVNTIVGIFILMAAGLIVLAILLGPRTERWFKPAHRLLVRLPPEGSLGLRKGADVLILGLVVGSVDDITVSDAGEMEAELSIRGDFIRFVRTDSEAIIRKPLGIGDASIEITRGKQGRLPDDAALPSESDKAPTQILSETLTAVRSEALPALREIRAAIAEYTTLATELRGQQNAMREAVGHVNQIAGGVERGQGLAGMLFSDPQAAADVKKAMPKFVSSLDELQAALADARKVTSHAAEVTDAMAPEARNLPQTMADLRGFVHDLKGTWEGVQKAAAGLPELERSAKQSVDSLPGLVFQLQETARQVQRLAEAMQRSWLLRGYMDEPGTGKGARISPDRIGAER